MEAFQRLKPRDSVIGIIHLNIGGIVVDRMKFHYGIDKTIIDKQVLFWIIVLSFVVSPRKESSSTRAAPPLARVFPEDP